VALHNGPTFLGTQSSEPVLGAHPLDSHAKMVTRGRKGLQKRFRGCLQLAVQHDVRVVLHEADRHGARMQSNAAVK
jgi:hypothetical protein